MSSEQENQSGKLEAMEIAETPALESISRAEIDMQITTAKKYPRMLSTVKREMLSFATLDQETAEACFYSLPRGGKNIQGPSVRLAEIAVSCYGNLRAGSRIIQAQTGGDNPHVVVQAVAHDLEKNTAVTIEKRRRITGKKIWQNGKAVGNKPPDEDDINLAVNAGSAIAFRDAVFKVIPMALVKPVFEAAKKVAVGDASTLVDRRGKCLVTFAKMGVSQAMILAKFAKKSIDDLGLEQLEELIGLHNAIRDGNATVDEAFAPEAKVAEPSKADEKAQADAGLAPAEKPATTTATEVKTEVVKEPNGNDGPKSPQEDLADMIVQAGYTFEDYRRFAADNGDIKSPEAFDCFDSIPLLVAKRHLRAKVGVLARVKHVAEGGVTP